MFNSRNKRMYSIAITVTSVIVVALLLLLNRTEQSGQGANRTDVISASQQTNEPGVNKTEETVNQPAASKEKPAVTGEQAARVKEPLQPSVQADIPSLAKMFVDYFPIGAAIEPDQTTGLTAELLKKHVNWLVAENVMKPDAIQSTEGNFRWDQADQIVAFAKANGMMLRFHTLVWHNQVGAWFFKDLEDKPMVDETDLAKRKANKKLLLKRLDTHVRTIVGRYKDDIKSWDVVNEVIEPGDPDGMRASDWYKITGTDYIETAFRAAREAGGPDAKLYINDYGTDDPRKRDLLYGLVNKMLDKGVPIDGVGHQTHINIESPSVDSIIDSMRKFHELGLDNLITELDMSIYAWNDRSDFGANVSEDVLRKQAERYRQLFDAFKANKDILSGVVFWGIADDHTWLHNFPVNGRTDAPLLFDQQLHAKPAFWALQS